MDERRAVGASAGPRPTGPLGRLPFNRHELDPDGGNVVVQVKVLTSDRREFDQISKDLIRAFDAAKVENVKAIIVTDGAVEMTMTDRRNIAQFILPEITKALGLNGAMHK